MRKRTSLLLLISASLFAFACNLKLIPRDRVLFVEDGWFLLSDNSDMVFLNKRKDENKDLKGFFVSRYDKGFRENFGRLNYDTCASFLLGKKNYLLSDSLGYQSFLYDREKIKIFSATIYYRLYKSKDNLSNEKKTTRYEKFYFSLEGSEYKTKIDRYTDAYVVGLTFNTKCNPRFH